MRFLHAVRRGSIDVAVDVGAAMGSYSWILGRRSAEVYAFEPGHFYYRYLKRVVLGSNVNVIQAAVGSVCDKATLFTPGSDRNALHSATLSRANPVARLPGTHVDQIDQVTLDEFFSERLALKRSIDVLKVDVEGYELDVFRGSIEVLSKYHPLIFCEIEARHNARYKEVFDLLRKLGYDCYIFRGGAIEAFEGERIEALQTEDDLTVRMSSSYRPDSNKYINNFVFQHPQSRIRVKQ